MHAMVGTSYGDSVTIEYSDPPVYLSVIIYVLLSV